MKPWIFERADEIIQDYAMKNIPLTVIQLGDNIDDFYATPEDYRAHNGIMVWFKTVHPKTIWLLGNHEVSYLIHSPVTGNVKSGETYAESYYRNFEPKIACIIDNVIFSHAGISDEFLTENHLENLSPEEIVDKINEMSFGRLWTDIGPLWVRPQIDGTIMYQGTKERPIKQVVGHTPLETVSEVDEIISTDVFSTNRGESYGEERFIIIDTETGKWEYAN
ncbi:MAG: metallophosphoesterase [Methanobrevibacter sp.]|nr:metallophosphoesterase [Methanobrevibacter sp.]